MPLRPELRHFYRGPEYKAQRARIMERAGGKCEQCGVPNHRTVLRAAGWWAEANLEAAVLKFGGRINGKAVESLLWHDPLGNPPQQHGFPALICRWVGIVLTMAHLDHDPANRDDSNVKMLCQWCHLNYDKLHHKDTRAARKDAARPLLQGAAEFGQAFEAAGRRA